MIIESHLRFLGLIESVHVYSAVPAWKVRLVQNHSSNMNGFSALISSAVLLMPDAGALELHTEVEHDIEYGFDVVNWPVFDRKVHP